MEYTKSKIAKKIMVAKITRAGIMPWFSHGNVKIYVLGIDSKTGEYSDFGGGVKKNEDYISSAFREFDEESCGIFIDSISVSNFTEEHVWYDKIIISAQIPDEFFGNNNTLYEKIIFLQSLFKNTREKIVGKRYQEMSGIHCVCEQVFKEYLDRSVLWELCRNTIANGIIRKYYHYSDPLEIVRKRPVLILN